MASYNRAATLQLELVWRTQQSISCVPTKFAVSEVLSLINIKEFIWAGLHSPKCRSLLRMSALNSQTAVECAVDNWKRTVLPWALQATGDEIMSLLLGQRDATKQVQMRDKSGRTPLHYGAWHTIPGNAMASSAKHLLDSGAELNTEDL